MIEERIGRHAQSLAKAVALLMVMGVLAVGGYLPQAEAQQPISLTGGEGKHGGEFVVPVNKSQILRVNRPIADLLVGNPEIADVLAITDRSVYVLGKQLGSTSLTIYGPRKELIAVVDLVVSVDVEGLKSRLHEIMPNEAIEVRAANGSVILSGTVSSATAVGRALAIADRYAPKQVTNLLTVAGSQQVMLEVRFAEVSRLMSQQLGLNAAAIGDDFSFITGESFLRGLAAIVDGTPIPNPPAGIPGAAAFATGAVSGSIGNTSFNLLFDALERKGLVKTLAEPNLIALSGDTASFLAGGEFPVPVAQDASQDNVAITVEFKEFGVGLAFTPTVLDDGLINLVVAPEVSRIDRTNSVVVQGFNIPGLSTRRANTTVELRDGQSFAIAGLIQSDFTDTINQFPGLGDVPVLSALFRSSEYLRNETELVIIVTPHLVKPAPAGSLAAPTDGFVPPDPVELYLLGRLEGAESGAGETLAAQNAGGVVGKYGHIIK